MQSLERIWDRSRHECSECRTPSADIRSMSASDRGSGRRYNCSDSQHVAERADETAASRGDDQSLLLASLACVRGGANHAICTIPAQCQCNTFLAPDPTSGRILPSLMAVRGRVENLKIDGRRSTPMRSCDAMERRLFFPVCLMVCLSSAKRYIDRLACMPPHHVML